MIREFLTAGAAMLAAAAVSAGLAQDGFSPEILPMQAQVGAGMAEAMQDAPMYQSYAAIAP